MRCLKCDYISQLQMYKESGNSKMISWNLSTWSCSLLSFWDNFFKHFRRISSIDFSKTSDTNRVKNLIGYEIGPVQMCVKISLKLVDTENLINWYIPKTWKDFFIALLKRRKKRLIRLWRTWSCTRWCTCRWGPRRCRRGTWSRRWGWRRHIFRHLVKKNYYKVKTY